MHSDGYDHLVKVVLAGDTCAGKTALVTRFAEDHFNPDFAATIGVDFKTRRLNVKDKNMKLQVWDTAGHQRFRSIIKSYYRNAHAIAIVFDLTTRSSFNNVEEWIDEMKEINDCYRILVGTKSDLKHAREVEETEINEICKKYDMKYVEVSAKTGFGVNDVFTTLCGDLLENSSILEAGIETSDFNKYKQVMINKNTKKYFCCSIL